MDLKYMAGLFDGEGSIGNWSRGKNKSRSLEMQIRLTNESVIRELHSTFGGSVTYEPIDKTLHPNWNDTWCWKLRGKKALALFTLLEPELRIKRLPIP